MSGKRVLVTGGRGYADYAAVARTLFDLNPDIVAHGGARGADSLADDYCKLNAVPHAVYPADWQLYGKAAGVIRNQQMLNDFKPDLVVAFPGGRGTAHMVSIAKAAGVEVIEAKS